MARARQDRPKGDGTGVPLAGDAPAALRRLWGVPAVSGRGRPAELDVERVVQAALELADRDGLPGLALPRVAKALGYTTMSLYRHVGSKEELLNLVRDRAVGSPPTIAARKGAWREGLRAWARAERALYQRRPWLARLPVAGPPSGPGQIAWLEAALQVLRGVGLDWAEKLGLLTLLSGYVRQQVVLSQDLARGRAGTGLDQAQAEERYGRTLATLVDARRFPETAALFASGVFAAPRRRKAGKPADDPDFDFGLERILDGAAAAVARPRPRR